MLEAYWNILCDMELGGYSRIFSHPDYPLGLVALVKGDGDGLINEEMNAEEKFLLISFVCSMLESENA